MLNDGNLGGQEQGMGGTPAATGIVDIERIDAHQGRSRFYEDLCCFGSKKGMGAVWVFVSAPVSDPSGMKQDGLTVQVVVSQSFRIDAALARLTSGS